MAAEVLSDLNTLSGVEFRQFVDHSIIRCSLKGLGGFTIKLLTTDKIGAKGALLGKAATQLDLILSEGSGGNQRKGELDEDERELHLMF